MNHMLRRTLRVGALLSLFVFPAISQDFDEEFPDKNHALGFKARFPVAGLNYIGWFRKQLGVEAIGTFFSMGISGKTASLKMIGLALRARTSYQQLFPYAGIGFTKWYEEYDGFFTNEHYSSSSDGMNIFVGIEYFRPELRYVGFDAEVGYGTVKLQSISMGTISYGVGIHLYF